MNSGGPPRAPASGPEHATAAADTTLDLLRRVRSGDAEARERLCKRYLPRLRRWATGRLPRWARGALDTEDIVQEAFLETLSRLDRFEPRHPGALYTYLRQTIRNRVWDEVQRSRRRPAGTPLDSGHADAAPSPLEETVGRETLERYEAALSRLSPEAREAVLLRVELDLAFDEIADWLGKPSPDAARMVVNRALVRLAKEMGHER